MNSEGLVGINVVNAFTVLFYMVLWAVVFYVVAQVARKYSANNGTGAPVFAPAGGSTGG